MRCVLYLIISCCHITYSHANVAVNLIEGLHNDLNREVLLLHSNSTQAQIPLEEMSAKVMPIILANVDSVSYKKFVTQLDCNAEKPLPPDLTHLSHLPWRNIKKSLVTWLTPQFVEDLNKMLAFMER